MSGTSATARSMPVPARSPEPGAVGEPRVEPRPANRPVPPPSRPARLRPRARRRHRRHPGFVLFSSSILGLLILGLVAMNALVAQGSFRIDDLTKRIEALSERNLVLTREQATLSAPGRIAAWARRHDMRLPDVIHILHVPNAGRAAPAGVPDALDVRTLRSILRAATEALP